VYGSVLTGVIDGAAPLEADCTEAASVDELGCIDVVLTASRAASEVIGIEVLEDTKLEETVESVAEAEEDAELGLAPMMPIADTVADTEELELETEAEDEGETPAALSAVEVVAGAAEDDAEVDTELDTGALRVTPATLNGTAEADAFIDDAVVDEDENEEEETSLTFMPFRAVAEDGVAEEDVADTVDDIVEAEKKEADEDSSAASRTTEVDDVRELEAEEVDAEAGAVEETGALELTSAALSSTDEEADAETDTVKEEELELDDTSAAANIVVAEAVADADVEVDETATDESLTAVAASGFMGALTVEAEADGTATELSDGEAGGLTTPVSTEEILGTSGRKTRVTF
jgi:hypothetical protein